MQIWTWTIAWVLVVVKGFVAAHEILDLESNTFEVTLTAFQYLAILFYDDSERGKVMERHWVEAGTLLGNSLPEDAQMAKVIQI